MQLIQKGKQTSTVPELAVIQSRVTQALLLSWAHGTPLGGARRGKQSQLKQHWPWRGGASLQRSQGGGYVGNHPGQPGNTPGESVRPRAADGKRSSGSRAAPR